MSFLGKREIIIGSALEKKKYTEDQIAKLKSKVELEESELNKVHGRIKDGLKQIEEIEKYLIDFPKNIEKFSEEISRRIESSFALLEAIDTTIGTSLIIINQITDKVSEQRKVLDSVLALEKESMDRIGKEQGNLETAKRDLNIYKSRLEKRIKDAGFEKDIKIILQQ